MDDLGWHDTLDSYPKDGEVVLGEYRGEYFVVRYHRYGYGKPQFKEDYAQWESMCCRFPIRNVDKWRRIDGRV